MYIKIINYIYVMKIGRLRVYIYIYIDHSCIQIYIERYIHTQVSMYVMYRICRYMFVRSHIYTVNHYYICICRLCFFTI